MNAKRKKDNNLLEIIIRKLNVNNIIITLITGFFGYMTVRMNMKQDEVHDKQVQSQEWQHRRDSINKIMFAKQDSILTILKTI